MQKNKRFRFKLNPKWAIWEGRADQCELDSPRKGLFMATPMVELESMKSPPSNETVYGGPYELSNRSSGLFHILVKVSFSCCAKPLYIITVFDKVDGQKTFCCSVYIESSRIIGLPLAPSIGKGLNVLLSFLVLIFWAVFSGISFALL